MPVVANHMTKDLLTLEADAKLGDAAKRMAERGVGAVVVLDGERLSGMGSTLVATNLTEAERAVLLETFGG